MVKRQPLVQQPQEPPQATPEPMSLPEPSSNLRGDEAVVGLDPGLSGGMAVLAADGLPLFVAPWPVLEVPKSGGGEKTLYDLQAVKRLILTPVLAGKRAHYVLETQQAMPMQGVTSMFATGLGYGILQMALVMANVSWEEIRSGAWQKVMFAGMAKPPPRVVQKGKRAGTLAKVKASSVLGPMVCQRLWPALDLRGSPRAKTPHDGICDALLMAECVRRSRTW